MAGEDTVAEPEADGALRILVSNDDGINAPGLKVAERIAREISADVWVVAPETEQSGASHSLTINHPIRVRKISSRRFAVSGTPTDCVMLAVHHIVKDRRPDLVISGVNRGANLGEDVIYSGTVAAAHEGATLGIRSVALSQAYSVRAQKVRWTTAQRHGPRIIRRLLAADWPSSVIMNVNFPDEPSQKVARIAVTSQGRRDVPDLVIDERVDPRGRSYFWLAPRRNWRHEGGKPSDLQAIYVDRLISVTPLQLNRTDQRLRRTLEAEFD